LKRIVKIHAHFFIQFGYNTDICPILAKARHAEVDKYFISNVGLNRPFLKTHILFFQFFKFPVEPELIPETPPVALFIYVSVFNSQPVAHVTA
jgi:hypothetical protein